MTFSRKAQIAVAATDMVAILVASMLAAQMRLGMWYGSGMETYYAMTLFCAQSHFFPLGDMEFIGKHRGFRAGYFWQDLTGYF